MALYDENRQLRQELGREASDPSVLGVQIRDLPDCEAGGSVAKMVDNNAELKQRLEEERKLRQEAEKELDLQVFVGLEMEKSAVLLLHCCENKRCILEVILNFSMQLCLKAEMEVAMKLLEKDIHEKQDTIVSLRRQLDDIKLINLEMYKKLQVCNKCF